MNDNRGYMGEEAEMLNGKGKLSLVASSL